MNHNAYLLRPGGPGLRHSCPTLLRHRHSPFFARRPTGIGASRPRLQDGL